jgi:hypothetical protein
MSYSLNYILCDTSTKNCNSIGEQLYDLSLNTDHSAWSDSARGTNIVACEFVVDKFPKCLVTGNLNNDICWSLRSCWNHRAD